MSLFKRLLGNKSNSEQNLKKDSEHSKYFPEEQMPIDEKFTYNFNKNGGLLENDWYEKEAVCLDDSLKQRFDGFNLKFVMSERAKFLLSKCESLVANNGSILLSSNQIKEKKLPELPFNVIIFATTSQLVENISEGMRIIKSRSRNFIPSNITTIQDFECEKEKDFMTYGSSTKNLYLILMEDL